MGSARPKRPHVVVLSYPAQGHMNPMMEFAKRLVSKNLHVTFVTTETIRERMCDAAHGRGLPKLHDIKIETISDGFPPDFDGMKDIEMAIRALRRAGALSFENLIERLDNVSCIVYDGLLEWVPLVVNKFCIPSAFFWTQSCAVYSIYYHYHSGVVDKANGETEKEMVIPGLPPLNQADMPCNSSQSLLQLALDQFTTISQATWILGNSFRELETSEIKSMDSLLRIRTIGPQLPTAFLDGNNPQDTDAGMDMWKAENCRDWLNTKGKSTVVYVSFGSMAVLSKDQNTEIALGLKASGYPFLWVIRPADKKQENTSPRDFPDGFLEETADRGLVVPWCPQMAVLCHPSVGVFMMHGGWNSTLESLSSGVPVLVFPQWSDQTTNCKYIQDVWKTGMRLKKGAGGLIGRDEVEKSIRTVMEMEQGVELRKNALRWKVLAKQAMVKGGSSDKNIQDFVEDVVDRASV
ncbi:hypothetical protein KI387_010864 [Taxus chinensis]|uniref:Glycosyltransferase n=1 Tax=Taxus chinensis TaxID=29808 RepID=A0AA38FLT8_TAXCH|nr:hypothetical protein KI387_010864 [Taxus chinensis]